jgi:hypothetical protein
MQQFWCAKSITACTQQKIDFISLPQKLHSLWEKSIGYEMRISLLTIFVQKNFHSNKYFTSSHDFCFK